MDDVFSDDGRALTDAEQCWYRTARDVQVGVLAAGRNLLTLGELQAVLRTKLGDIGADAFVERAFASVRREAQLLHTLQSGDVAALSQQIAQLEKVVGSLSSPRVVTSSEKTKKAWWKLW